MAKRLSPKAMAAVVGVVVLTGCSSSPEANVPTDSPAAQVAQGYDALTSQLIDAQWASVQNAYPTAVRPEVSLIRYETLETAPAALDACLGEEGFPQVSVRPDGALESGPMPKEQQEPYAVSTWKCMAQYPFEPRFNQELSEEQITEIYEYYAGPLTACLQDAGYEISEAPSKNTFVEGYYTAPDLWNPFADVVASAEKSNELHRTCPAYPPELFD